jgi:glucose/mannose-6-phosphate isomerase
MVSLDSSLTYEQHDPAGMIRRLRAFPADLKVGWHKTSGLELPAVYSRVNKAVVLGMGGSAVGGEVLGDLVAAEHGLPVTVQRDFDAPPWLDAKTLVVAVSFSGNTEETLSACGQALASPAKLLAVASGGRLAAVAKENRMPLVSVDCEGPPRAAFAYMFGALAGIFSRLRLASIGEADMLDAASRLERTVGELDTGVPAETNPSKQLATRLTGKMPVIYGGGFLAGAARRWKTQFNENSKRWAFFEVFPELVHNAVTGYRLPARVAENALAIVLRSQSLHPRTLAQYEAVAGILKQEGVLHEVIDAGGGSPLTQVLRMILLGDFTSYYLAMLNGVDPTVMPEIDAIKKHLAGGR